MTANRLMWISGSLFVVFGLLMAIFTDAGARNFWGGLSVGSLGIFAFSMAWDGVAKGKIRIQFDNIKRASQPRLFWAAISLVGAAGVATMATAVWVLFFKAGEG